MPTFTSPFTGTVVQPTDVSYYALTFSTNQELYWPAVVNPTQVPAARIIDCTPTVASLTVKLPQGDQGSVGTDILIRNRGAVPFTITASDGSQSVTVTNGTSRYFYLSSNSTTAGVWQNVQFGTGTSAADAASLQSYGLTTLDGKLATTGNIVEVSSIPVIADTSRAATFVWTAGNSTFTLPNVATLSAGWYISFRNNGTGTLNITPTAPSLINGLSTIATNPGDSGFIILEPNTGNFFTVGFATPANTVFTSASYDVDSIAGANFSLVSFAPVIQTYVALSGARTSTLNIALPSITQIYILVNSTGSGLYNLVFNVSGSAAAPITLGAGQTALVLSDGNQLYALTQTTTGSFFANNGSVSAPTFSFTSNTSTGMYLFGTSILGLAANSGLMLKLDNSNTLSPQVSTPATFTAGLISGGTF
jgi:hypothetical protein